MSFVDGQADAYREATAWLTSIATSSPPVEVAHVSGSRADAQWAWRNDSSAILATCGDGATFYEVTASSVPTTRRLATAADCFAFALDPAHGDAVTSCSGGLRSFVAGEIAPLADESSYLGLARWSPVGGHALIPGSNDGGTALVDVVQGGWRPFSTSPIDPRPRTAASSWSSDGEYFVISPHEDREVGLVGVSAATDERIVIAPLQRVHYLKFIGWAPTP